MAHLGVVDEEELERVGSERETILDRPLHWERVTSRSFRVFHGFWLVSMVFQGSFMVFHGFWLISMDFMVPGWFFMVFLQNVPAPNCILAQRSSLDPPPGGRHRT